VTPTTTTKRARSTQCPALDRLAELHELAMSSPQRAQDETWEWLRRLGREDDQAALAELFGEGTAASPRTRTIGMPVGRMRDMPGVGPLNAILAVDCPWTGKSFHPDGSGGYNRVKLYSAPIMAALRHRPRLQGRELIGFPFDTTIKRGVVEPRVDVLAIEYDRPEHGNPSGVFPLTRIVDELVEIVPDTYLGRATWPREPGDYVLVGYFALKRPVGTAV